MKTTTTPDLVNLINFTNYVKYAKSAIRDIIVKDAESFEGETFTLIRILRIYGMPDELLIPLYRYNLSLICESNGMLDIGDSLITEKAIVEMGILIHDGYSKVDPTSLFYSFSREVIAAALKEIYGYVFGPVLGETLDLWVNKYPIVDFYIRKLSLSELNAIYYSGDMFSDVSYLHGYDDLGNHNSNILRVFLECAGIKANDNIDHNSSYVNYEDRVPVYTLIYQNLHTRKSIEEALDEVTKAYPKLTPDFLDSIDLNLDYISRPGNTPVFLRILRSVNRITDELTA